MRHDAAIDLYSKALSRCDQAPPRLAAILSANRAAAYQAKGLAADAVADALRATALDPSYTKVRVLKPAAVVLYMLLVQTAQPICELLSMMTYLMPNLARPVTERHSPLAQMQASLSRTKTQN